MDNRQAASRQTHNISLDADTSRMFLSLIRRRFNIAADQELPRGVVSWYVTELVGKEAAAIPDVDAQSRELAIAS